MSLDDLAGEISVENLEEQVSDKKITIISPIENVMVNCNKVQSSNKYKGGKDSLQYALFGSDVKNTSVFGIKNEKKQITSN